MTTLTFHATAGRRDAGLAHRVRATLAQWRDRIEERAELARWNDRDLHDIGMSPADANNEIRKPFWRG